MAEESSIQRFAVGFAAKRKDSRAKKRKKTFLAEFLSFLVWNSMDLVLQRPGLRWVGKRVQDCLIRGVEIVSYIRKT